MKPLKTLLIGFGQIAAGLASNHQLAKYYPYATHAQVLKDHPAFLWEAVVDPSEQALSLAQKEWGIPYTAQSIEEVSGSYQPEIVVMASPPYQRSRLLKELSSIQSVRGLLVEKPLALSLKEALDFQHLCQQQNIPIQVNLWRRGDEYFRALAAGKLEQLIGQVQHGLSFYGKGLYNNGIHMIDLARFLMGEFVSVQAISSDDKHLQKIWPEDLNPGFILKSKQELQVVFQAQNFDFYRENSMEMWGSKGKLSLMNEGLCHSLLLKQPNRALENEYELAYDQPLVQPSTVGEAFYHMYTNLAEAVNAGIPLFSPLNSAMKTVQMIAAIQESLEKQGQKILIQS